MHVILFIAKMFEGVVNSPLRREVERQLAKKKFNPCSNHLLWACIFQGQSICYNK
jgi:hypothetical protein